MSIIDNKKVFPIVSKETQYNYRMCPNAESLDNSVKPLLVLDVDKLRDEGYIVPSVIHEGMILIRHPYHPKELVYYTKSDFFNEKLADYAVILNLLGAKKQNLEAKVVATQRRELHTNGKIKIKGVQIEGRANAFFRFTARHRCQIEISGTGKLDYPKALERAKELGLENDTFIHMMLELRRDNPINSCKTNIEISQEYNKSMDAVASLSTVTGAFDLDGDFDQKLSKREQIFILHDIMFQED